MSTPVIRDTPISTRRFLPMVPRAIEENWTCKRSGDCCSIPHEVVMTREERLAILPRIPEGLRTEWREVDERFVALKAGPCPFYIFKGCLVYAVRPYNCRRFACMRPDPKSERFEGGGAFGCKNAADRILASRAMRRLGERIQRKAQRWAEAHGWSRKVEEHGDDH